MITRTRKGFTASYWNNDLRARPMIRFINWVKANLICRRKSHDLR